MNQIKGCKMKLHQSTLISRPFFILTNCYLTDPVIFGVLSKAGSKVSNIKNNHISDIIHYFV